MLKNFALATFVALGAAAFAGISSHPAAAENTRSPRGYDHGGYSYDVHVSRYHRRRAHASHYGPNWRFLKRVRNGKIVCFKKLRWRHDYRYQRRAYRAYRVHGRRLGYRAVRRLVRHGRRHAMRCYRNV